MKNMNQIKQNALEDKNTLSLPFQSNFFYNFQLL